MAASIATDDFIRRLPKAELHLHIEGTLEPELMFELAARNRVQVGFGSAAVVREAYRFADLESFLDLYYEAMRVLVRERDFFDLTAAYLRRARADGVVHAEVFFDPQAHTGRGVAFGTVLGGISRALDEAERELGITSRLIPCFLRDLDEADAERTLDEVLAHVDRFAGVGLDSAERGNPPRKFEALFRRAREAGLATFAHAGEEGPADYVREAVELLGVTRIDHGNRALEDPVLVRRLAAARIPLTVCPVSNLRLCGVADLARHPLKRMLDAGLVATVNSDDPAFFGAYVADNYIAVRDALGLSRDDIVTLVRNSIDASLLDDRAKARWVADIESMAAGGD